METYRNLQKKQQPGKPGKPWEKKTAWREALPYVAQANPKLQENRKLVLQRCKRMFRVVGSNS